MYLFEASHGRWELETEEAAPGLKALLFTRAQGTDFSRAWARDMILYMTRGQGVLST